MTNKRKRKNVRVLLFLLSFFREESKPDSDMDEPWIMTVKGVHSLQIQTGSHSSEETSNHKTTSKVQNGLSPVKSESPPKDSNLNHYRNEKVVPVSIIRMREIPQPHSR